MLAQVLANIGPLPTIRCWTQWKLFAMCGSDLPINTFTFSSVYRVSLLRASLCLGSGYLTNLLPEGEMEQIVHSNALQGYGDIFIKVNEWGKFRCSEIETNSILFAQYIPDFVTSF
jgi:hypothetical protein